MQQFKAIPETPLLQASQYRSPGVLCLLTSLTVAVPAFAAPEVSGNRISWSDDGWYQVQSATSYQSFCQGGRSCIVEPGEYIVINHTTGERFDAILVGEADNSASGKITVKEDTISWPDDGYYQVQSATTYASLCEGQRACTVPPGEYIVINHTTGERFEGIQVNLAAVDDSGRDKDYAKDDASDNNTISVDGTTVTWPDDGWYQVQSATTFDSICEGGRFCIVEPGLYNVINHSTGQRFEGIKVAGDASAFPVPPPPSLDIVVSSPRLLEALAGYQLEQSADYVFQLADAVAQSDNSIVQPGGDLISDEVSDKKLRRNLIRVDYNCPQGGSMRSETQHSRSADALRQHTADTHRLTFSDCRIDVDSAALVSGAYQLDGTLHRHAASTTDAVSTSTNSNTRFHAFTMTGPDGIGLEITASSEVEDSGNPDYPATREVEIDRYQQQQAGTTLIAVDDAAASLESTGQSEDGASHYRVALAGNVAGQTARGKTVQIMTGSAIEHTRPIGSSQALPQYSGHIQLSAMDGTEMTLSASSSEWPTNDHLPIDIILLGNDGQTLSRSALPVKVLPIHAPRKALFR